MWRVTAWDPPNSHNGILDMWLDLGLLGLSVYLLGFISSMGRGLVYLRQSSAAAAIWPIMYLMYFWCSNQTESGFLRQNEIYWLLYVVVTVSLIPARPISPIPPELGSGRDFDLDRSMPIHQELVHNVTTAFYTLIKTENRSPKSSQKKSSVADAPKPKQK